MLPFAVGVAEDLLLAFQSLLLAIERVALLDEHVLADALVPADAVHAESALAKLALDPIKSRVVVSKRFLFLFDVG